MKEINVIKTDTDQIDGQVKCPKCGSSDISTNTSNGRLRCNFCRFEFENIKMEEMIEDIAQLEGVVIGSGAKNIEDGGEDLITLKCPSCGAEVVINTLDSTQSRCHWCRSVLSINNQIPNGAVPDAILPFTIKKEEAKKLIENFVGKRKFYASPQFKKEFNTNNVMGVYFPYMLVDVNSNLDFYGYGEKLVRSYTIGDKNNKRVVYDADEFSIKRSFNMIVKGLSIESSSSRLNTNNPESTNNIINALMPYDVENISKFNSNYLNGFTSEKRDINVEDLEELAKEETLDIARNRLNSTINAYSRGVRWEKEFIDIKGQQWKAAYLPVWLFSYLDKKTNMIHYVGVNARTKETIGSIPIFISKLLGISAVIEAISLALMFYLLNVFQDSDNSTFIYLLALVGIIYYLVIYEKYRNTSARHTYERETSANLSNMIQNDHFVTSHIGVSNPMIYGANNNYVSNGARAKRGIIANKSRKNVE